MSATDSAVATSAAWKTPQTLAQLMAMAESRGCVVLAGPYPRGQIWMLEKAVADLTRSGIETVVVQAKNGSWILRERAGVK